MSEFSKSYPEGCGWWCRRRQDLRDFLATPEGVLVNSITRGALGLISNSIDMIWGRIFEIYLTPTEQLQFDNWHKVNYLPFLQSISERAGKFIVIKPLVPSELIEINQILKEIQMVVNYYLTYQEFDARQEVFDARVDYIIKTTDVISGILHNYVANQDNTNLVSAYVNYNYSVLSPVIPTVKTGTFECIGYSIIGLTDPINVDPATDETNGGSSTSTGNTNSTGSTNPTETTSQNKNSSISNKVIGGALIFVGYKLLS